MTEEKADIGINRDLGVWEPVGSHLLWAKLYTC